MSELTSGQRHDLASLKGNPDASLQTLLEEYSREFAWGPNATTANRSTPEALCKGATDREGIMNVADGHMIVDPDTLGLVGIYQLVDDHTITVADGNDSIEGTYTYSFRISGGDKLTLTQQGLIDPWTSTPLEEAAWFRAS